MWNAVRCGDYLGFLWTWLSTSSSVPFPVESWKCVGSSMAWKLIDYCWVSRKFSALGRVQAWWGINSLLDALSILLLRGWVCVSYKAWHVSLLHIVSDKVRRVCFIRMVPPIGLAAFFFAWPSWILPCYKSCCTTIQSFRRYRKVFMCSSQFHVL